MSDNGNASTRPTSFNTDVAAAIALLAEAFPTCFSVYEGRPALRFWFRSTPTATRRHRDGDRRTR